MFSLFNTKPFYSNSIEDIVGMPSLFDYVFAFYVDQNSLEIDYEQTKESFGEDVFNYSVALFDVFLKNVINNKNSFHLKTSFCEAALIKRKT